MLYWPNPSTTCAAGAQKEELLNIVPVLSSIGAVLLSIGAVLSSIDAVLTLVAAIEHF